MNAVPTTDRAKPETRTSVWVRRALIAAAALYVSLLILAPLGALAAVWRWPQRDGVRRLGEALLLGGGLVIAIETSQVLVLSRITSITEVMNMEQDVIIMQEIFRYRQLGIDQNGRAYGQFEATGVRPSFINRLEAKGVKLPSNMFQERVLMRDY